MTISEFRDAAKAIAGDSAVMVSIETWDFGAPDGTMTLFHGWVSHGAVDIWGNSPQEVLDAMAVKCKVAREERDRLDFLSENIEDTKDHENLRETPEHVLVKHRFGRRWMRKTAGERM